MSNEKEYTHKLENGRTFKIRDTGQPFTKDPPSGGIQISTWNPDFKEWIHVDYVPDSKFVVDFLHEASLLPPWEERSQYPNGKLQDDDEGAVSLAMAADPDNKVIRIRYSKPVSWFALDLTSAQNLHTLLGEKIKELEDES